MNKYVEEAPYYPGYEDASFAPSPEKLSVEERIKVAYQEGFTNGWNAALVANDQND